MGSNPPLGSRKQRDPRNVCLESLDRAPARSNPTLSAMSPMTLRVTSSGAVPFLPSSRKRVRKWPCFYFAPAGLFTASAKRLAVVPGSVARAYDQQPHEPSTFTARTHRSAAAFLTS
jgi:hypothetical protein